MSDQYNVIADQYDMSFQLVPFRLHIEAYTVFKTLGDISGKSVLDLATGTGFYARAMSKRGALKVVAVDIANEMVQIGRMAEQAEPLGIEYHTQDIMQFQADEPFDIALAVYLLHYAPTQDILLAMCQSIANNLKSGGRFVTYILSPDLSRDRTYYHSYGMDNILNPTPSNGEMLSFTATIGGITTPPITAYRWDKETVNQALTQAGFVNINWVVPSLSSEGKNQHGAEHFDIYLKQPHAVLIECVKK